VAVAVLHLGIISMLSFFAGDWCWGPRYLVVTAPLLALAVPFSAEIWRKRLTGGLVAAGVIVQILGVSVEQQRYFLERGMTERWGVGIDYFHRSALFARPFELASVLIDPPPPEAVTFLPSLNPSSMTHNIVAPPDLSTTPKWMRGYSVFYLPRPWPLWMRHFPRKMLVINPSLAVLVLLGLGLGGAACVVTGLRAAPRPLPVSVASEDPGRSRRSSPG
jgi:hypothetical protein